VTILPVRLLTATCSPGATHPLPISPRGLLSCAWVACSACAAALRTCVVGSLPSAPIKARAAASESAPKIPIFRAAAARASADRLSKALFTARYKKCRGAISSKAILMWILSLSKMSFIYPNYRGLSNYRVHLKTD
jgi:hypothetical protein